MTDLPQQANDHHELSQNESPQDELSQNNHSHSEPTDPAINIPLITVSPPVDTTHHKHKGPCPDRVIQPWTGDYHPPPGKLGSPFSMPTPERLIPLPHEPDEYDESDLMSLDTPGGPVTPAKAKDARPVVRKSNFDEREDQGDGVQAQGRSEGAESTGDRDGDADMDDVYDEDEYDDGDSEGGVDVPDRDEFTTPEQQRNRFR